MQHATSGRIFRALAARLMDAGIDVRQRLRLASRGPLAWALAGALLACLVRAGLPGAPTRDDETLLTLAILAALPWSLAVALWDLDAGFGTRAAWVLACGLALNLIVVARCGWWLWQRLRGAGSRAAAAPAAVED